MLLAEPIVNISNTFRLNIMLTGKIRSSAVVLKQNICCAENNVKNVIAREHIPIIVGLPHGKRVPPELMLVKTVMIVQMHRPAPSESKCCSRACSAVFDFDGKLGRMKR